MLCAMHAPIYEWIVDLIDLDVQNEVGSANVSQSMAQASWLTFELPDS